MIGNNLSCFAPDGIGHSPKWKYLLDVVNCKGTLYEIKEGVYVCPDTGVPYSHRRAKYFCPYSNKKVSEIWEIKAIVVVDKGLNDIKVKWNNPNGKESDLKKQAKGKIENWDYRINENKSVPLQIFLLHNRYETNFRKNSSGGMQQSKKYFWDIALDCENSEELARKLMKKIRVRYKYESTTKNIVHLADNAKNEDDNVN